MSWICKTLLVCLTFNPVMDYTNNDEFIEQVQACAVSFCVPQWGGTPTQVFHHYAFPRLASWR